MSALILFKEKQVRRSWNEKEQIVSWIQRMIKKIFCGQNSVRVSSGSKTIKGPRTIGCFFPMAQV
jgi:hypothetical protein